MTEAQFKETLIRHMTGIFRHLGGILGALSVYWLGRPIKTGGGDE